MSNLLESTLPHFLSGFDRGDHFLDGASQSLTRRELRLASHGRIDWIDERLIILTFREKGAGADLVGASNGRPASIEKAVAQGIDLV
jgi:hypothetical protein